MTTDWRARMSAKRLADYTAAYESNSMWDTEEKLYLAFMAERERVEELEARLNTHYRRLEQGEVVQEGDEFDFCNDGYRDPADWRPVLQQSIGRVAPDPQYISHAQFRRPFSKDAEYWKAISETRSKADKIKTRCIRKLKSAIKRHRQFALNMNRCPECFGLLLNRREPLEQYCPDCNVTEPYKLSEERLQTAHDDELARLRDILQDGADYCKPHKPERAGGIQWALLKLESLVRLREKE